MVVGAGVAGLRAAIELSEAGRVLIIAKDSLIESSSEYAQGGIAVALSDDDELELHEQDTIAAGDGLCNYDAVRTLVEEGPAAIEQLIGWGTAFDRNGSSLLFAREGAHSRNRVLHAKGDSTGHEIVRSLRQHVRSLPNITFRSFSAVTDLLVEDGRITGISALDAKTGSTVLVIAKATLLATGGIGRVFENTTNPDVATGDGVACAYRAGAEISDIEFVQFHPTALYIPNSPRFLLTEALRGEGAYLRNASGERFMARYHVMGELAPRDVVSRSIVMEMRATGDNSAFLDLTHLPNPSSASASPASTRPACSMASTLRPHRLRYALRPTTRWEASGPTCMGTPAKQVCSQQEKRLAPACTEQTAWRAIPFLRQSCLAHAPALP